MGLCGRSGSGKDAIAEFLVKQHGFSRIAIADPLKAVAALAFNLATDQLWGDRRNALDERWALTPRQLYQQLGDALRSIHPCAVTSSWELAVSSALRGGKPVVVPDIRMPVEARWLRESGGVLWRVVRPGLAAPPGGAHETETALDQCPVDSTVMNDSTLEAAFAQVTCSLGREL